MTFFVFLFGLSCGSFFNVLIDRLPQSESLWFPGSHCDFCRKPLRWFELVPVLSFLLQLGRCRRCRRRINLQYPVVELISGLAFVFFYQSTGASPTAFAASVLLFGAFLVIAIADFKYQVIPDQMVAVGTLGALLLLAASSQPRGLIFHALAGAVASALLLFLWYLTKGQGLGLGDVKLVFLLGLVVGFPRVVIMLYAAFLTGAIVGVILILIGRKKWKSRMAFGPFLIIGFLLATAFGEKILVWWQRLL